MTLMTTEYSTLDTPALLSQLESVSQNLAYHIRALGVAKAEHNRDRLSNYARSPASSFAAKDREAEYNSQQSWRLMNEEQHEVDSMVVIKDLILTILKYRA